MTELARCAAFATIDLAIKDDSGTDSFRHQDEDEVARFSENQFRFPGVQVKARLMRHYPFGEHFSHVLGYVGRINVQELAEIRHPLGPSGSVEGEATGEGRGTVTPARADEAV